MELQMLIMLLLLLLSPATAHQTKPVDDAESTMVEYGELSEAKGQTLHVFVRTEDLDARDWVAQELRREFPDIRIVDTMEASNFILAIMVGRVSPARTVGRANCDVVAMLQTAVVVRGKRHTRFLWHSPKFEVSACYSLNRATVESVQEFIKALKQVKGIR